MTENATTVGDRCCWGSLVANESGEFTQETGWEACRRSIREAIQSQLEGEQTSPVVVDGLPTIGKTHQAHEVAYGFEESIAILTHRYETRDDHLENALADTEIVEVPALDRHCPTRRGEHGQAWRERIGEYRNRGASPTYLHYHLSDELPCMRDDDCEYLDRWDEVEDAPVVVGGPVHAGLDDVVKDRVVIFDEDPGQVFRTEFDANSLAQSISAFLARSDDIPVSNYGELMAVSMVDAMSELRDQIREELTDSRSIARPTEAIAENGGHSEAPTAALAMLEFGHPIQTEDAVEPLEWGGQLSEETQLEFCKLQDGAQVVYDQKNNHVVIRRPPSLGDALAVVGLDGTPVQRIWRGRLGVENVDIWRVLCDDCRARYLQKALGYEFIQTSRHVKPYSSGRHVNRLSDYGLIEGVANEHDTKPGIITTKSAENRLFKEDSDQPYVDRDRINRLVDRVKHYGDLRSSNVFEGTTVGIVLGSTHPGDRPIQITAALEGDRAVRNDDSKGKELDYGIPGRPYLRHYRENKVAQAALRFGRTEGATVYIHTRVMPDWLAGMVSTGPKSIGIHTRSQGQRSVIAAMLQDGPGSAEEISKRGGVTIGLKHTRDCLNDLLEEGIVSRDDKVPYTWYQDDLEAAPHTARVSLPSL